MLELAGPEHLRKIVVLNPKGGSGKTTLAFNLAGYLASTGRRVALLDMDRQASSHRWLQNRPHALAAIRALSPPDSDASAIRVPEDVDCVVIDAPAALAGESLADFTCGAHAVLVPVLPSDLDIHAAAQLVSDLLLKAQLSRRNGRLGIVANRVKEQTLAYRQLMRFLERLSIRLIGVLRDSQNYVHAAGLGRCIHEMTPSQVRRDREQWQSITEWLENRLATPLNARDWLRPMAPQERRKMRPALLIPAAAAAAALAIALWFLAATAPSAVDVRADATGTGMALLPSPVEPTVGLAGPTELPEFHTGDSLRGRWQLTGVVQAKDASVLVLTDRTNRTTVQLAPGEHLEGWAVKETGTDFAVLAQHGEEVRLQLSDEPGD